VCRLPQVDIGVPTDSNNVKTVGIDGRLPILTAEMPGNLHPSSAWAQIEVDIRADDHAAHYAHRIECRRSRERKTKRFSMIYVHRRLKAVDIDAIYPDKLAIDDGMAPTANNNNLTTSINGLALTADDFMRTLDGVTRKWGVTLSLPAYTYVHEQHYDVLLSPIIKVDCVSEESENTAFNGIFALSSFIRNNIFYVTMVLVTIFCDATKEAQGWGACEGLVDWQGSAYDIIDIDTLARSPKRSERRGVTRNKSDWSCGNDETRLHGIPGLLAMCDSHPVPKIIRVRVTTSKIHSSVCVVTMTVLVPHKAVRWKVWHLRRSSRDALNGRPVMVNGLCIVPHSYG
jgi:hypothetical protein